LISIFPALHWFKSHSFEIARWADSDYSPYQSSGDDE
jgi:hypothetical protein